MLRILEDVIAQAGTEQDGHYHNPIEDQAVLQPVFAAVDAAVDIVFQERGISLGTCHLMWDMKKDILLRRFGVTWFSPSDLNPEKMFD